MDLSLSALTGWLGTLMWPFFRFSGLFLTLPIFSAQTVPARLRIMLAVSLTVMIAPLLDTAPAVDPLSAEGILITVTQLVLGMTMGLILQIAFASLLVAGEGIAMSMGLGFAQMTDPQTGFSLPVISNLFNIFGALVFLAMDGHLLVIRLLVDSFAWLPAGSDLNGWQSLIDIVLWASNMYAGAVLIALPAFAAMLLVNLGFGVITRAAPQLNIFAVGFPLTISLGFVIIWMTLPGFVERFAEMLNESYGFIARILQRQGP